MWTLPGGGVQFGEDPADATIRELAEETGLQGVVRSLAFVHSGGGSHEDGSAWHAVRIVYEVDIVGGELRDEVDESTDAAAWFSLADARQLPIVEVVRAALDHIGQAHAD
jgi:ADP-ribose pyrophosphatase YjhB (NUDIX family)